MEIWKPVPCHPQYEVSNLGNVRSSRSGMTKPLKQRLINSGKRGGIYWGFKVRTGDYLPSGHPKTITYKTHRLVALLFIGPQPPDMEVVMHIDESRDNNKVENLKYATHRENINAAIRMKLLKRAMSP